MDFIFHVLFFIFSLYVLFKTVFYGIYEFKTLNNKLGGISVICFSLLVIVLANIILIIK